MKALLDHLGIAKVRLVAHDWGAVILWQFCFAHPEMVDRYAALSVGHPTAYATASLEQARKGYYIAFFQLRGFSEWACKLRNWWLFRRMTQFPAETPRWIRAMSRPGRLTAAINLYRANIGIVKHRRHPAVHAPVMGIWSDGDIFLAESQMRASEEYVEGPWRYERIAGANHWVQLAAAEKVNALLLDFLREDRA